MGKGPLQPVEPLGLEVPGPGGELPDGDAQRHHRARGQVEPAPAKPGGTSPGPPEGHEKGGHHAAHPEHLAKTFGRALAPEEPGTGNNADEIRGEQPEVGVQQHGVGPDRFTVVQPPEQEDQADEEHQEA